MTQAYQVAMEAVSASAELLTERVIPPPRITPEWRAFCDAAQALSGVDAEDDHGRELSRACAADLLRMAERDDASSLAIILRPDPAAVRVTWTVACYQIGDLTPSALRDYPEPAAAVAAVAACEDPSHVAAELLASTDAGLRWAALVRSGEQLGFHVPPRGMSDHGDDPVDEVAARWQAQLPGWAATGQGLAGAGSGDESDPTPSDGAHFRSVAPAGGDPGFDLGFALGQLMATVRSLEAGLADAQLERERTERRLEAIEAGASQRIAVLEARLAELEVAAPPAAILSSDAAEVVPAPTLAAPVAAAPISSAARDAASVLWSALRVEAGAALTGLAQRLARRVTR